ncbi:MAG: glycoside hydrolase family 16 protein [Gammaproteobacteria bacterium]
MHHASLEAFAGDLDINAFHTFTIRWLPDQTEWYIDGLLIESSDQAQPDMAAPFRINFWAPAGGWSEAYYAGLKPVNNKRKNQRYYYDVDWVEIRRLP